MNAPATDWKETPAADEATRYEQYATTITELQKKSALKGGVGRALHRKSHGGLRAEFTVLEGLPEHARQGMFARAGVWKAYVRFSNGSSLDEPDKKGDVRGIGVKIVGVDGRKVIPGMENARTQDFLFIHTPATPFRSSHEFMAFVRAAASPALLPFRLIGSLGFGRTISILKGLSAGAGRPVRSVLDRSFFTAVPIKYGPYAARFRLVPAAQPTGEPRAEGPTFLRDQIAQAARAGQIAWEVQVQFFVNEAQTPIENSSVDWSESVAPFLTVGRLSVPAQDPTSDEGRALETFIETLSFDPWHALEEHRPLGDIMRARNVAYRESTRARGAHAEPDGTEV